MKRKGCDTFFTHRGLHDPQKNGSFKPNNSAPVRKIKKSKKLEKLMEDTAKRTKLLIEQMPKTDQKILATEEQFEKTTISEAIHPK